MPRLPTSVLRRARQEDPLLPLLLRACRDLPSACNELRWLREHAFEKTATGSGSTRQTRQWRLHDLCLKRSKGKPLQYILGSQPFGDLDILCKPGVLIPRSAPSSPNCTSTTTINSIVGLKRPETESIITHLASTIVATFSSRQDDAGLIRNIGYHRKSPLRILDLCTGTGCIPLLLHSLLPPTIPHLQIVGVDISPTAIDLAKGNVAHNIARGTLRKNANWQVQFYNKDIFAKDFRGTTWMEQTIWDVVVSNPPYISPRDYDTTIARSVRNYEPKGALVPPTDRRGRRKSAITDTENGDAFYPYIQRIAASARAKILLVEVADMAQAGRVAGMVLESSEWKGCEIWRDWPAQGESGEGMTVAVDGKEVEVKGEGNGRAMLAWRAIKGWWY